MFDTRHFPGENVLPACLKLKAVINVLEDKLPSNAVCTVLEGFAQASTKAFLSVCDSKIAMWSDSIHASLLAKVPFCYQVASMLDDHEQKYQQLIAAKKWGGLGHIGANHTNISSFKAAVAHNEGEWSYAAYVKSKSCLPSDDWAKSQTCQHCGKYGHICPLCKKFLAEKANDNLPLPVKKHLGKPAFNDEPAFYKDSHCDKFNKDPKLKAILSAFAAFTSDYIAGLQDIPAVMDNNHKENTDKDNEENDKDHAFGGMVVMGSLEE